MTDLLRGDRGEPGTVHRNLQVGGADQFKCLFSYQFSFGIKVGGNGDLACLPREFLEEVHDLSLGRHLDGLCIDQAPGGGLLAAPVLVTGFKVHLDNMPPQPDGHGLPECVRGDAPLLLLGDLFCAGQDLRYAACRYVLFRDNDMHGGYASLFLSDSTIMRFSSPGSDLPRVIFIACPTRKLSAPFFPFR